MRRYPQIRHSSKVIGPKVVSVFGYSCFAAGRLDKAIGRALGDEKNGRVQPLWKRGFIEHRAISQFWQHYHALQAPIRSSADKQFSLLKGNPQHRSLQFRKIGDRHGEEMYSARMD